MNQLRHARKPFPRPARPGAADAPTRVDLFHPGSAPTEFDLFDEGNGTGGPDVPGRDHGPRWNKRWWSAGVFLAVLVLVAVAAQTRFGGHTLGRAGIIGSPQRYTELFFPAPNRLPTRVPSGHVALKVPFQIRNSSQAASTYKWTIDLSSGGKRTQVAAGEVSVAPGASAARTVSVAGLCQSRQLEVFVNVRAIGESIDFRVVCGA